MLISVIIPAFNAEDTLHLAIDSALDQDVQEPIEVLVYDDASTDGTLAVAQDFMRRDPRVRVLKAETNGGLSSARNALLAEASGDWIACLDADDIFLPGKLAICLRAAADHASDYVTHDLGYLKGDNQVIGRISNAEFMQALLFRRHLADGMRFSETLVAGEDSQFLCIMKKRASAPVHIPAVLTALKIRRGSLTDEFWFEKRLIELWHARHESEAPPGDLDGYKQYFVSLPKIDRLNYLRKWRGQKFGRLAAGAMLDGRRLVAARYLVGSLLLDPGYAVSRARSNLARRAS